MQAWQDLVAQKRLQAEVIWGLNCKTMAIKRHDKQKEVTSASFKRLAKQYRAMAKLWRQPPFQEFLRELAEKFDEEAELLRSMR